jgi:hypothetical protein
MANNRSKGVIGVAGNNAKPNQARRTPSHQIFPTVQGSQVRSGHPMNLLPSCLGAAFECLAQQSRATTPITRPLPSFILQHISHNSGLHIATIDCRFARVAITVSLGKQKRQPLSSRLRFGSCADFPSRSGSVGFYPAAPVPHTPKTTRSLVYLSPIEPRLIAFPQIQSWTQAITVAA